MVPNGRNIGILMGDKYVDNELISSKNILSTTESTPTNDTLFNPFNRIIEEKNDQQNTPSNDGVDYSEKYNGVTEEPLQRRNYPHPFSILFTVFGVILLDFSCDACQSPCRAYMLDVTIPEDHPRGLSTFTVLAGNHLCFTN